MEFVSFTDFPHVEYDSPPISVYQEGSISIILHKNSTVSFLDTKIQRLIHLPARDKTISSCATCAAINQSKTNICVAYEDGSLALYEVQNMKLMKAFPKFKKHAITKCKFYGDQAVLLVSNNQISLVKISSSLFGVSIKDQVICQLQNSDMKIRIAPVFENKQIINQKLQNVLFLTTPAKTNLVRLSPNGELKAFDEIPLQNSVSNIFLRDINTVLIVSATQSVCCVHSFDGASKVKEIARFDVCFKPIYTHFISKNVVLIVSDDFNCLICDIKTGKKKNFSLDEKCVFSENNNTIFMHTSTTVRSITGLSFNQAIYNTRNDFNATIGICRDYLKGDLTAGTKQKETEEEKTIEIEQNLKQYAFTHFQSILQGDESLSGKVADELLDICEELKCYNLPSLICNELFHDCFKVFVEKIIERDPNASRFIYSKELTENIINAASEINDSKNFVLSLPKARPHSLLSYAQKINDHKLVLYILENIVCDITAALKICFIDGNYDAMNELILQTAAQEKFQSIVAIDLIMSRNNNFEVLTKLYEENKEKLRDLLIFIKTCTTQMKRPFTEEVFVDRLCEFLLFHKVSPPDIIYTFVETMVMKSNFKLAEPTIAYLSNCLLSENKEKEPLLIKILSQEGMPQLKHSLLYLCDERGFNEAKVFIQMQLCLYSDIVVEYAATGREGIIFKFLKSVNNASALSATLVNQARLLISLDVNEYIALLRNENVNEIFSKLNTIEKNVFAYKLSKTKFWPQLKIQNEDYLSYARYLIKYHPAEVLGFISTRNDVMLPELLNDCESAKLYEATANIGLSIGDGEVYLRNLCLCIREALTIVASSTSLAKVVEQEKRAKSAIDLLKNYLADPFAVFEVLRSFALSFYALNKVESDAAFAQRKEIIIRIFMYFTKLVPQQNAFPILQTAVIAAYSENGIPELRKCLFDFTSAAVSDITIDAIGAAAGQDIQQRFSLLLQH